MTKLEDKINTTNNTNIADRKLYKISKFTYQITINTNDVAPCVIYFHKFVYNLNYDNKYINFTHRESNIDEINDGYNFTIRKGKLFSWLDYELDEYDKVSKSLVKKGIPVDEIESIRVIYYIDLVDFSDIKMNKLKDNLSFEEYSQLVFDRENELRKIMMGEIS